MYPFFVYGTLRTEGDNYSVIAPFIARRQKGYLLGFSLYTLGTYPMAFASKEQVVGELYWIIPSTYQMALQTLDQLEGHPKFYRREAHLIQLEEEQTELAWVYVAPPNRKSHGLIHIISNDWFQHLHQYS